MAELKQFLDFAGLAEYDKLLKEYIKTSSTDAIDELSSVVSGLTDKDAEHDAALKVLSQQDATHSAALTALQAKDTAHEETLGSLSKAITTLNSDSTVAGSVEAKVQKAVNDLIDGAPDSLDTLKEVADWIAKDESGTVDLLGRVAENANAISENANAIKELSEKEIASIKDLEIMSLFPVKQKENESAVAAINALPAGQALKLAAEQEIVEDLVVNKPCYIDANGSTFSGQVSIPAGIEVIIENANFSQPVVIV